MGLVTGIKIYSAAARSPAKGVVNSCEISGWRGVTPRPCGSRIVKDKGADAVMEKGTVVLKCQRPALTGVLAAKLDIVGLIVDGLDDLCYVAATARSEWKSDRSFSFCVLSPVLAGEGPSWVGRVADGDLSDLIKHVQVNGSCVGVGPYVEQVCFSGCVVGYVSCCRSNG